MREQPVILSAVPTELQYMNQSTLLETLGTVLEEFMEKQLITARVAAELARLAAEELDKQFDQTPVSEAQLDFDFGEGIANYRFDQGLWQLVVKGPLELSVLGVADSVSLQTDFLAIEGNGSGLSRGATKTRGKKRKVQEAQVLSDEDY